MNNIEKLFFIFSIKSDNDKKKVLHIIEDIINNDRKRLLKKLTEETAYEYDDIFDKVKINLAD